MRVVRVKDINPAILENPFSLKLARAIKSQYLDNGAMYLGIHVAPHDLQNFFLTTIVDETSPDRSSQEGKLMVQAGTQYGCSSRICPFCVYPKLKYYRNLTLEEIIDLFRIALFIHGKLYSHKEDNRKLSLKFTDNGEPLESPILPSVLDHLLILFGKQHKVLNLKISTVLKDTQVTRDVFQKTLEWQKKNANNASIHLQISRSPYGRKLIPAVDVASMIEEWCVANPRDRICIAPGLIHGYNREEFIEFCDALRPVAKDCFFRLSVIKPTTERQRRLVLTNQELEQVNNQLRKMGFVVDPLPQNSIYTKQLEGAGTLSHNPNGKFYDPVSYHVCEYIENMTDPNIPIDEL